MEKGSNYWLPTFQTILISSLRLLCIECINENFLSVLFSLLFQLEKNVASLLTFPDIT